LKDKKDKQSKTKQNDKQKIPHISCQRKVLLESPVFIQVSASSPGYY
jgi:hypothetical protein